MNILSEPLVNDIILFSFLIFFFRNVISNLYKKLWFSIYPESCSSNLHVVITAYNSLKYKFYFIKYKFISNCILCFSVE